MLTEGFDFSQFSHPSYLKDFRLHIFDMELEQRAVVDLGYLGSGKISRIEFVSNSEVYLFEKDGSPWISVCFADLEEKGPVVTSIKFRRQ